MMSRAFAHGSYRPILFVPSARLRGKLNRSLSYALVLEASALDGGGGIFVCVETRALALTLLSALALELVVRCASFHCRAADEPTLLEYFVGAAGSINSWSILAWPLDELRCPVSGLPETLTSIR
jgi:hypothetical protein